jgi:hypothetical protein
MFVKTMMPPAPDHADDDFARVIPTGKAPVVRFNFLNARIASGHRYAADCRKKENRPTRVYRSLQAYEPRPYCSVAVVGNIPELGEWEAANALLLHNREHPMWRAEVAVAAVWIHADQFSAGDCALSLHFFTVATGDG